MPKLQFKVYLVFFW